MPRTLLAAALAGLIALPAIAMAADGPDITIYHAGDDMLYQPGQGAVDSGYAIIREKRRVGFEKGTQDLVIDNLPDYLEPAAIDLDFQGDRVKVLSQRLLLSTGGNDALLGQIGKQVSVIGDNGQVLVKGVLQRIDRDGSLVIGGDVFGPTVVRRYSAVKLVNGEAGSGSRLQVRIRTDNGGHAEADLSYPAHGLGWRAAYTGTLQAGSKCRMRLKAMASIANRSGRAWDGADVTLFAGQPNIASEGTLGQVVMAAPMARSALPRQRSLDAYRTYSLPGSINLPDNSVTLTPLYAVRSIDCERQWVYEIGNAWTPPKPMTTSTSNANTVGGSVESVLDFQAPETLPAGRLRVLTDDGQGSLQFIGEGAVPDTSKLDPVSMSLGTAFDLRAQRDRTSFQYDAATQKIDEAFRVTLNNAGDTPRTVRVIEHPNRWNQWTLQSSSAKPVQQTGDTLAFDVDVPAHGSATLDYALRYQWTPADQ